MSKVPGRLTELVQKFESAIRMAERGTFDTEIKRAAIKETRSALLEYHLSPQWVSVEAPPEKEGAYKVWCDGGEEWLYYSPKGWINEHCFVEFPTHWTPPLPAPPVK